MAREKCGLLAVPRLYLVRVMYYPYTAHVHPSVCSRVNAVTLLSTAVTVTVTDMFYILWVNTPFGSTEHEIN